MSQNQIFECDLALSSNLHTVSNCCIIYLLQHPLLLHVTTSSHSWQWPIRLVSILVRYCELLFLWIPWNFINWINIIALHEQSFGIKSAPIFLLFNVFYFKCQFFSGKYTIWEFFIWIDTYWWTENRRYTQRYRSE